MVKEFRTYLRKIDNIMQNQCNNVTQLEHEIIYLIISARKKLDDVYQSGNNSSIMIAQARYEHTYNYLKTVIENSHLSNRSSLLLFLEEFD